MPSPILARADALIQRRRLEDGSEDIPVLTDVIESEADLPVLNDQEATTAPPSPAPSALETSFHLAAPMATGAVVDELCRRIEQRLIAELPRLIAETVQDWLEEGKSTSGD